MAERVPIDLSRLEDVPSRLHRIARKLSGLFVEGPLIEAERVVAIVGTRYPGIGVVEGTRYLAERLARYGIVVVSGGAIGVDAAAHEGALAAGGLTWCVLPHGPAVSSRYPNAHELLFERIVRRGGSIVYPFPATAKNPAACFLARNEVIAALADALIVTQAPLDSGSRNACTHARKLGIPVWAIPPAPWFAATAASRDTMGAIEEIRAGAKTLHSLGPLIASLGLTPEDEDADGAITAPKALASPKAQLALPSAPERPFALRPVPHRADKAEQEVIEALVAADLHPDEITQRTCLSASVVTRALLTLRLDTVVVDLVDGRYHLCR